MKRSFIVCSRHAARLLAPRSYDTVQKFSNRTIQKYLHQDSYGPSPNKDRSRAAEIDIMPEENDFVQVEAIREESFNTSPGPKLNREVTRSVLSHIKAKTCTAHFVAQKINLLMVYNKYFKEYSNRMMGNYLLIVGPDRNYLEFKKREEKKGQTDMHTIIRDNAFLSSTESGVTGSYIVIFSYGSVVFFNMSKEEQEYHLDLIQLYGSDLVNPMAERLEEELVYKEVPELNSVGFLFGGEVLVRSLDINIVSIISSVIGLTVALDFYENHTDEMMERFNLLNNNLQEMGNFKKEELHKLMARQNGILLEVVDHLALIDRSDITWECPEYDGLWDGLRSDYELIQRFSKIEWRLNLIQRNAKFFLEILHHQKSTNLEWTIVILISVEIAISLFNMSQSEEIVKSITSFL